MKKITLKNRNILLIIGLFLCSLLGFSQSSQTFTSSGTWTCPAGITTIAVEAWGAGGAGGGNASNRDGGGGGGGGAYSKSTTISVTPGVTYTVNVGTGGTGTSVDGTAGGDSWFDSTSVLLAKGGAGGISGTLVSGAAGGIGGATASGVGTTKFSGGTGGAGRNNGTGMGGPGGSSAGTGTNGTAGAATWTTITAGAAPTGGGKGGDGGSNTFNGIAGSVPGGGGGGAGERVSSTIFTVGGDGANGQVIISWTCSATHNLTSAATATGPICQGSTSTVTLRSTSMVSGTYTVTYDLSGANTATGNTATMTFTAGSPGTGTFTTSSLSNAGATTVTVTALTLGTGCPKSISTNNTASVTVNSSPTAVSGTAITTCSTSGAINITAGSSATNQTSITWTSNGTGTFANPNSLTTCTYTPSAADIAAGSRILTLTAVGTAPCANATSTKTITITSGPSAVAGTAIGTCSSSGAVNITTGSSASNYSSVTWTSNGTGIFTNANSLTTCTYTPSAADITAGSLILTLTAVNAGCTNATSTKTITINAAPTAAAGTAIITCSTSGSVNITAGSSATNYSSVIWTSSGTGSFANANSLTNCTYNPSAADITSGSVTLTLTAVGNSPCSNATSTKILTISKPMTAVAGTVINACSTGGAVNITTGSSATNQTSITWTSNGTGTFANANSLTTCTYTPSAADISSGGITMTLTASNSGCSNVTSTKNFNITPAPTSVSGTAVNTCSTSGAVNITAGSSSINNTGINWTSSGIGIFANANSLTNCTYIPSAADILAGSVTLTLTATGNAPCSTVTSSKILTIYQPMVAIAGTAVSTCSNSGAVNITAGSSATNQTSVTWTSSGTGVFANPNSLTTCTYTPSAADITAGSVTITLTASNPSCSNVTSTKTLTIKSLPTAIAGTAINTCSTSGAVNITAGSSATNQTSITWTSSGTGTFANATSLTTCTYTPSAADITAGSVTLTLTATGNAPCGNTSDTKIVTIYKTMTSVAGSAVSTCSNSGTVNITGGSSATNQTSVTWTSSGTGVFANPNSLTTCTYTPSAADITAGSVTITLTASNPSCSNVTSTKTLTIKSLPTAIAGTAINTCSTSGAVNITAGSSATNQTSITWTSNGTGTFANATSLTTCTYTPSAADITAGSITLTLTATGNAPCGNVTSTKTLTISKTMTVSAGTTVNTCASSGAVNITTGSSATNQTSVTWTSSGTGTFVNANSLTTCTYTPSAADISAGSVILTLTASNAGCTNVTSTKTLTINATPTSVAGTAITTCANTASVNITAGSSATNQTSVTWSSSGTGTFTNVNSLTTCTYTQSAADNAAGSVTLTLTSTNAGCSVTSTKTVTITPSTPASVIISTSSTSICLGANATFTATPTNGGTTPSYQWKVNGTNVGTNSNTYSTTTLANGNTVTCVLTSNATPCLTGSPATSNTLTMTVNPIPTITSTTPKTRTGVGTVLLGATASSGTVFWYDVATGGSSLGSGNSFTTPSISATTTYYAEAVSPAGCASTPRTAVIATVLLPEINIQGNSSTIISGETLPNASNWTDFGTATTTRTFTIQNLGTAALTIGAITFTGANAGDFTVTTPPSSVVLVGSSTTFVVTFNASAIGIRSANISIDNNDIDENPYSFAIQGTGVAQEINILGNAISIVDGDSTPSTSDWTDFSSSVATRTFTIQNTGNITLNIGTITISGTNSSDFTITTPPSPTVAAYSSTTFTVTFNPGAIGSRVGNISIVNNDSNENPYDFAIAGFGIIPEINLQGNGVSISDNDVTPSLTDWTDFGTGTTRTFTFQNLGNLQMTIGAITISGTNASDFSITTPPSSTIPAFGSTTFVVTFNPGALGSRVANISIVNNDSNENPYDFAVQGTGIAREINVQGNGNTIADATGSTSSLTDTDFGSVDVTNGTVVKTYTIQNLGTFPLTISNPTVSGVNSSDFTISTNPGTLTIAGGASTTFSVTFNPSALLSRNATINIVNNDSDENPYDFAVAGFGFVDTDGDGVDNNTDKDDDNDGILDTIECSSCNLDPFANGSFESPVIAASSYSILPTSSVPGWQTSAENFIEIWSSGFSSGSGGPVTAAAGNQFAELNANVPGTLYQTFCLSGASGTISWSIKHRGRAGVDVAYVKFGVDLATAQASSPIVTMSDGNTAWGTYSGVYTIPVGQTQIVLAFQAGATASGSPSVGNFIDDIQIIINQNCIDSDGDGIADSLDLDDENDGIPDIEEAGFRNLSSNFSKISPFVDANGNGMSDSIDAMITAGTYTTPDKDGDGVYNHLDMDSDNDSLFDVDEAGTFNGDGDINDDGKGDLLDADGDGILDLYDNLTGYGTNFRAFAVDSDYNGISDYLETDSDNDGINDIQTGLYGSYDANNDGVIDGPGDVDRDGITDTFDTNDAVKGSPRDLNRKLYLDFDGRNDYGQGTAVLGGLANATLMAWIDLNSAFSTDGVIVGQNKFQIRVTAGKKIEAVVNSTTLTFSTTTLNTAQWYHVGAVYGGGFLKLFLNGQMVASVAASGNIAADASLLTLGRDPSTATKYFKGKIDEVRIFNVALTDTQFQRMVHQEIQNTSSQVRGLIIPYDIGSLPFSNVLRYYRMDAYKDDIIDDLTTAGIDTGTGMKIYNHKVIKVQQAPMPFVTITSGNFATAVNDPSKDIKGQDVVDYDSSIIQVKHNITESSNNTDIGMFIDSGITVTMNNDNKLQNDWYLDLDGKIDLQGKSQLIQTTNSILEVNSAGSLERDQSGQSNKFNYNYWSSPVGALSTTSNNNPYTVDSVMKDGTDPANIKNITWTAGYNGDATTSPITLSNYWIFKFQNVSPVYANWAKIGQNGSLLAGQGFTLKGSGAATATQNYTFVGKPNNGSISSPIAANNSNLSGNPYPSALDANAFINANLTSTTGTLYFWEHYSTNSSHILAQYQGGYATRTLVGGTPPVSPSGISGLGTSTRIPGRYIPVGQGFFVNGSATGGTINFDNSQRAFIKENDAVNSNVLFRQSSSVSIVENKFNNKQDAIPAEAEYGKIRLGFNSSNDFHRQLLLGFMNDKATAGIDPGYDANLFDIQPNDMYFVNGNTKLVIQGDGYFNTANVYPLAIKTAVEGKVKFTLDATESFDASQKIYIYDNATKLYHDIRNEVFEVSLPAGTVADRFSLRFKNDTSLATNNFENTDKIAVAFTSNDNMININNNLLNTTVKSVTLFNILGQAINTWKINNEDQTRIKITVNNLSTGTYIVKAHTTNGDISKKIIIN